ncbi:tetratricopeptide repeat protein, partial [bacterium AH-315-C20]|nr:tetratricopeptide repeat protein [bacterium AH-315-C20]
MRFLLLIFFFPLIGFSQLTADQEAQIDSLKEVIETAEHDTVIINAWMDWDNIIWISDPELDFKLNKKIDSMCSSKLTGSLPEKEKNFFLKKKAFAYNSFGIIYKNQGNYASAIDYYTRSLTIHEEIGDKRGIAMCLNNIGLILDDQGDHSRALDYHTQSLSIKEEIGDKKGIAASSNNIGLIYYYQGDYANARDYCTYSLNIYEEIGHKRGIAMCLNSIGLICKDQGDSSISAKNTALSAEMYTDAIDHYTRSLTILEEIGDKPGIALSLISIGDIYYEQGEALLESLQKDVLFGKAITYSRRALSVALEIGHTLRIKEAAEILYISYKAMGEHQMALQMHELYITMRDSILSEENQKEVIRHQYKYEYEKQALADSVTHAKEAQIKDVMLDKKQAQLKSEQTQRYALYGGL